MKHEFYLAFSFHYNVNPSYKNPKIVRHSNILTMDAATDVWALAPWLNVRKEWIPDSQEGLKRSYIEVNYYTF